MPQVNDIENKVNQVRLRHGIVGQDVALQAALERAVRVAPIDLSVLVSGESGTGKEFFPRIIHEFSARKHNRYIAVNCGAIPEGTIDSELFGHEKGSFTGAVSSRKGYFEEANGGTIFLDEVAELPLTTQARLLRVLETGEFLKVGSSEVQHTDIRIVAATNVNLQKAIVEGRFREDLYYRLSTVQINVPALRDRGNDVYILARMFASRFAERYMMPAVSFGDSARRALAAYRWPGNVRQLKNVVEQMALFEAGREIEAETVAAYLPADADYSFAPVSRLNSEESRYEREREMLLGMLFKLQHELGQLREELGERGRESETLADDLRRRPFDSSIHVNEVPHFVDVSSDADDTVGIVPHQKRLAPHTPALPVEPALTEAEPETLRDTERETIKRALERNNGQRKITARELNISERTLYRKIKEYELG